MRTLEIEITDVRLVEYGNNIKAFVDVKFNDLLLVRGFKIFNGKKGVFVGMPNKAGIDGRWHDIVSATDEKFKREIEDAILEAYDREVKGESK